MPELTFLTAFALIFDRTAAHVILKLVVAAAAVLAGVGVTLVRVCKNIQCQSGSHEELQQRDRFCSCWKIPNDRTGIDVPELFLEEKDARFN